MQTSNFTLKTPIIITTNNYTGETPLYPIISDEYDYTQLPSINSQYDEDDTLTEIITFTSLTQIREFLQNWLTHTITLILLKPDDEDFYDNTPAYIDQSRDMLIQIQNHVSTLSHTKDPNESEFNTELYKLIRMLFYCINNFNGILDNFQTIKETSDVSHLKFLNDAEPIDNYLIP